MRERDRFGDSTIHVYILMTEDPEIISGIHILIVQDPELIPGKNILMTEDPEIITGIYILMPEGHKGPTFAQSHTTNQGIAMKISVKQMDRVP